MGRYDLLCKCCEFYKSQELHKSYYLIINWEGYMCISKHCQASWGSVRGISRTRGKALQQITKMTGVEKDILSRKMERQLAKYVARNPRTTLKTLTNDLTKSEREVLRKTVVMALDQNGLCGCRTLLRCWQKKRHFQTSLKYARNNLKNNQYDHDQ